MFLSLLVPSVFACGAFLPQEGALVTSDAQQALFELGADAITVTYRATYAGDAADFAWVLAVPGAVQEVAEGDAALLDAVVEASAPQVALDPDIGSGGGAGCGCTRGGALSKGEDGASDFGDTGVTVTSTGFAGEYAYTTLTATDAGSLRTWLTDHGYDIGYAADAIDAYVADPLGYAFVAVQLRPEAAAVDGLVELEPLRIRYGAAADGALHAGFPARMGRGATVEEVRTEIYVLASGTAALGGGWEAPANPAESDDRPGDFIAPDYEDPSGVYAAGLRALGGAQRGMWLAYAGAYRTEAGERWLTRFDAIVAPSTYTTDPELSDSGAQTEAQTVVYLMDETTYEDRYPTAALLLPLGLMGGALLRRRR